MVEWWVELGPEWLRERRREAQACVEEFFAG